MVPRPTWLGKAPLFMGTSRATRRTLFEAISRGVSVISANLFTNDQLECQVKKALQPQWASSSC